MSHMRRRNQNPTHGVARHPALTRAVQARRRLETLPSVGGRAWINGREVGGPDPRFSHLARTGD